MSKYTIVLALIIALFAVMYGIDVVEAGRGWCHPLSSCG